MGLISKEIIILVVFTVLAVLGLILGVKQRRIECPRCKRVCYRSGRIVRTEYIICPECGSIIGKYPKVEWK